MNLSPLRTHKKPDNIVETPSYICDCNQGIEDIRHFLIECLAFASHRASLAATVTGVLHRNNLTELANNLGLYLYGRPSLISVDNKRIILGTVQYINNTQRFSAE